MVAGAGFDIRRGRRGEIGARRKSVGGGANNEGSRSVAVWSWWWMDEWTIRVHTTGFSGHILAAHTASTAEGTWVA